MTLLLVRPGRGRGLRHPQHQDRTDDHHENAPCSFDTASMIVALPTRRRGGPPPGSPSLVYVRANLAVAVFDASMVTTQLVP
jgi:hypothetical protein